MIVQVVTTVNTESSAKEIARTLVNDKLAACVQIDGPIISIYRWEDKLEQATEWRITAKTLTDMQETLIAKLKDLHGYDVPEVLVQRFDHTDDDYLKWAKDQLG